MSHDRSGWIVGAGILWAAVGVFVAATAPAALLAVAATAPAALLAVAATAPAAILAAALVVVAGAAGVLVAVGIAFVRLYYAQSPGVTNHDHQSYR